MDNLIWRTVDDIDLVDDLKIFPSQTKPDFLVSYGSNVPVAVEGAFLHVRVGDRVWLVPATKVEGMGYRATG